MGRVPLALLGGVMSLGLLTGLAHVEPVAAAGVSNTCMFSGGCLAATCSPLDSAFVTGAAGALASACSLGANVGPSTAFSVALDGGLAVTLAQNQGYAWSAAVGQGSTVGSTAAFTSSGNGQQGTGVGVEAGDTGVAIGGAAHYQTGNASTGVAGSGGVAFASPGAGLPNSSTGCYTAGQAVAISTNGGATPASWLCVGGFFIDVH